ncbi:MAG: hypothetical protein IID49_00115 [Proteobacteria bacterium]|nr:hypothetical protein [Pseudomonadota bacterium]
MSLSDFSPIAAAALTAHVLGREPTGAEIERLLEVAGEVLTPKDVEKVVDIGQKVEEVLDDLDALRELMEAIAGRIARRWLSAKLAIDGLDGEQKANAVKAIRTHVTAHAHNHHRVARILRIAMSAAIPGDAGLMINFNQFVLGNTEFPGDEPPASDPEEEEKENHDMSDATKLRIDILEAAAINTAPVPDSLKTEEGQAVFIDAVIQAVALLGHDPSEADARIWVISTAGLLLQDGNYNPRDARFFAAAQRIVTELSGSAKESNEVEIDKHGVNMFAPTARETQRISIYAKVFKALSESPVLRGVPIFLQSFAATGRAMVDAYDQHLGETKLLDSLSRSKYTQHVSDVALGGGGAGGGVADLALPPLTDPYGYNDEIEPDNIRAVSTIYVSYQLEQMMMHRVSNRILELFMAGLLPISASDGTARELDTLYWSMEDFLDESARYSVYGRVLGAPGGQISFDVQPNSEFNTLLMRAVSSIAEYERERSILNVLDATARGKRFKSTNSEFVRKSMRDFVANASLRGWAGTAFTAERMSNQIKKILKILAMPSIRTAFGVTTPWQVVERVAQREFGETVNVVLHRTLAVETQRIMTIAADNHSVWSDSARGRALFSETADNEGDLSYDDTQALMVASQHFRAVSGVRDSMVDEYSQPVETIAAPSLPAAGGMAGGGAGGIGGIDLSGIEQIKQMVGRGQAPSLDQLRSMLPGF